ncbi:MAG: hypothetical protein NHG09_00780 [Candidatus Shikimatogenerans sp. JK-2022]|nr:hypothetical protein [Candidatus Shikimatogenerans bostrichidophilus]
MLNKKFKKIFFIDVKYLEKIYKKNVFFLINLLSKRSLEIKKKLKEIFFKKKEKIENKKKNFFLIKKFENFPNYLYFALLEFLNKKIIFYKKKNDKNKKN